MQTKVCSIYLLRKFDMFFVSLKTRYDINLVASATYRAIRHIECDSTYRKSRQRFISLISSSMKSLYYISYIFSTTFTTVLITVLTWYDSEIPVLHQIAKCSQLLSAKLYLSSPSLLFALPTVSSGEYKW